MDIAEKPVERTEPPQGAVVERPGKPIGNAERHAIGASWPDFRPGIDPEFEDHVRSDERGRIARELHDSTSQLLVVLELQLMRLKQLPDVTNRDEILVEMKSALNELHEQVRAVGAYQHLAPAALGDKLRVMAVRLAERTGVIIQAEIEELPASLSPDVADALYRISQEALANVSRHSNAKNVRLRLSISTNRKWVTLRVSDDGVGFPRVPQPIDGRGLANISARVEELRGKVKIWNHAHGATVEVRLAVGRMPSRTSPRLLRRAMAQ